MKKLFVIILAAVLAFGCCAVSGCSVKKEESSSSGSSALKYADNEFYEKSVQRLKVGAGLSDQEADAAFGVFLDCGLITKEITLVTKKADLKTGEALGYTVWIGLKEYLMVLDDSNKVVKISDTYGDGVYYENGKVVTEAPTTEVPTTEAMITEPPTVQAPATEAPTAAATEAPAETENPIVFTNYTNYVEAGSNATVTIQGTPNTEYRIHVYYDSGESSAQGLEKKTSDSNGYVTWEWKVGANTTPGLHAVKVEGGGAENSVQFEVLEEIN